MSLPEELESRWRLAASRFLSDPPAAIQGMPASGGFSGDELIQIRSNSGQFALRGWNQTHWPTARVLERHRWLRHLFRTGLPVAVPVPARETLETVVHFSGSDWQLEPWLPGAAYTSQEMTPICWHSMMTSLAKMHLASEQFTPSSTGRDWFQTGHGHAPAISERRKLLARWTPTKIVQVQDQLIREQTGEKNEFTRLSKEILAVFLRTSERIDLELKKFENAIVPLFPCFRDLWSAHVLFHEEHVSGWIDPTAARTDHAVAELARLLGSFLEEGAVGWQNAMDEYLNVRRLSPVELEMLQVYDRSGVLLSGMTWIDRWGSGNMNLDQLPEILQRVQAIVRRLHHQQPSS